MFLLKSATHRMLMAYDERFGHRYVAGLRAPIPHSGGAFSVRTNEDGFRSNVDFIPRRGATPRILAFGDSFTAGDGCENDARYPEVAANVLGAEIHNFGVSGTAPDQHLLMLETFARRFEPDLIVWGIPIHNIERIGLRHRLSVDPWTGFEVLVPKPYFERDVNGSLSLHHVPVPRERPEHRGDATRYADESYEVPWLERCFKHPLFEPLRRGVDGSLRSLKQRIRSSIYRGLRVQLYDAYEESDHPAWQLLARLVERSNIRCHPRVNESDSHVARKGRTFV